MESVVQVTHLEFLERAEPWSAAVAVGRGWTAVGVRARAGVTNPKRASSTHRSGRRSILSCWGVGGTSGTSGGRGSRRLGGIDQAEQCDAIVEVIDETHEKRVQL